MEIEILDEFLEEIDSIIVAAKIMEYEIKHSLEIVMMKKGDKKINIEVNRNFFNKESNKCWYRVYCWDLEFGARNFVIFTIEELEEKLLEVL